MRSAFLFSVCLALLGVYTPTHVEAPVYAKKHGLKALHIKEKEHAPKTFVPPPKPKEKVLTMEVTYYTAFCDTGCTGVTATGYDVSNTITTPQGRGIVAVDRRVIPLHTIVEIDGREYRAMDTGGAIKGHRIDVLVESKKKARKLGRVTKQVIIKSKQ